MKVGPYEISVIETGDFRLDGGAMFGVVPKVLWNRVCPSDERNRIAMITRSLLIEGGGRKILVDTGIGDKEGDKFVDLYAADFSRSSLTISLAARGIRPEDVTDVILTHLHFDHAGGTTRREGGKVVPTFPNARHYVQQRHFEHALSQGERDRASFLPHNYMPVVDSGLMEMVGPGEILSGIELLVCDGHTPAMQTVKVSDGSSTVWYPADLLPTAAHIPLPYIMGYDLFPVATLEEKKRLLERAVSENWVLVFEHDPQTVACRVVRNEKGQIVRGSDVPL